MEAVLIISGILVCPTLSFILLPLLASLLAGTALGRMLTHDGAWLDAIVTVCGVGVALVFGARLAASVAQGCACQAGSSHFLLDVSVSTRARTGNCIRVRVARSARVSATRTTRENECGKSRMPP